MKSNGDWRRLASVRRDSCGTENDLDSDSTDRKWFCLKISDCHLMMTLSCFRKDERCERIQGLIFNMRFVLFVHLMHALEFRDLFRHSPFAILFMSLIVV